MGLLVTPGPNPKLVIRCGKLQYCGFDNIYYVGCVKTNVEWSLNVTGVVTSAGSGCTDAGCGALNGDWTTIRCGPDENNVAVKTSVCTFPGGSTTYYHYLTIGLTAISLITRIGAAGAVVANGSWTSSGLAGFGDCDDARGTTIPFTFNTSTLSSHCNWNPATLVLTV